MSVREARTRLADQIPSEFRALVEDLRAILWEIDCQAHRFTWVSRHAEEMLGYPVEQWLEEPGFWENHIHREDRDSVKGSCEQIEAGPRDHQFEYRMIAADGRIVWLRHIARAVTDSQGQMTKLRGVVIDITEQRAAERALRESEERFRKLFAGGPIGMLLVGQDLRIRTVNQAFCTMLGRDEESLKKLTKPDFIHPDDRPECIKLVSQLFDGRIPSYKVQRRYLGVEGKIIWVDVVGTLVFDPGGNSLYSLIIAVDITEHKRTEETLRELSSCLMRLQEEERRRIGRELHDSTGQNLAALKLNLSRLDSADLAPALRAAVGDSLMLTDRMLCEIRTLSHLLHPPLLDELGLASAIRAYVDGFKERSGIVAHLDIPADLGRYSPEVETAVFRIIQEGLTNTYRHSGGTQCWITLRLEGDTLHLEVRDDGRSQTAETPESLAEGEPVFGVGLSGMRERARQLQGQLEIESSRSGYTVRSVFPVGR